jgi:hypothetical protein
MAVILRPTSGVFPGFCCGHQPAVTSRAARQALRHRAVIISRPHLSALKWISKRSSLRGCGACRPWSRLCARVSLAVITDATPAFMTIASRRKWTNLRCSLGSLRRVLRWCTPLFRRFSSFVNRRSYWRQMLMTTPLLRCLSGKGVRGMDSMARAAQTRAQISSSVGDYE